MIGDAAGGFIVSWHDRRTPDFGNIYAERVDANGNILWDPAGEPLCVATGTQQRGRLVPISNSGAIVSWDDDRTGVSDVYANMVSGSGGVSDAPLAGVAAPLLSLASQNPARGVARFQLQLPSTRAVAMDVMDVAGRRVRSLAHQSFAAGAHSLTWDGTDDAGVAVGSGVYFVRLTAGEARESSRVVMLR
jgi:hypothetical protein